MAFAFYFPGQGSQSLNMMAGFDGMAVVQDTFQAASDAIGVDLWAMLHADDASAINDTINTQPLMLAAGVATFRAYEAFGAAMPSVMAGHSLGEYSALVCAGSLDFEDATRLVRLRAQLMQEAVPHGQGAMAAILGLSDAAVREVCETAAEGAVVEAVNLNAPGQVVIAGNTAAVERAMLLAKEAGAKRALPLPVSVPSHCRLMQPAAEHLAEALKSVSVNAPRIPVIHNVDVQSHTDAEAIKEALVAQLYSPVRWTETVQSLVSQGIVSAAECGPGKVLSGLAKRIHPDASCTALVHAEALQNWAEQHPK